MTQKKAVQAVSTAAVIREPGSSRKNKTGSWRSSRPVSTDRCTGCGICVWYCPEGCIKIKEKNGKRIVEIDYDYCKGCMICVQECPAKAMESEKEGEE